MSSTIEIPLQEILLATNEFADGNLIAWGGFGPVYEGKSEKHGIIAVKRLDCKYGQGDPEFKKEIALLSEYKNENIVSLLGFCDEAGEKILIYKLESNGSLDKHINSNRLDWIQRLRICLDAARGLKYLHDDVGPQQRILHRDVKSANILLDENWNAKISDFGLSRVGPANMQTTLLISNACGTFGYIDPDYLYTGSLTQRSDVYSFGVVLFEVLCGRPTRVTSYKDECQFLTVLVTKHYGRQTLDKIIHFDIQDQIKSTSLLTFSTIAYQCLKTGSERPTMTEVVQQLQKALHNQLESSGSWPYDVYNGFGDCGDDNVDALTKPQQGNDNNVGAADSVASCHVDADIALYKHLWRACAGPLATVPRENELVFYLFQGHFKQIEASTNQVEEQNLPLYNLPAKILCRVANVQLRVEPDTDEVFAQITLMPEQNQDENAVKKDPASPPETQFRVHSFCKTLTASDTSMHDGFSVLRRHADECLPPLDMSRKPPTQELVARDLHGKEWRFRHIFEGQPPRHLLESGWSVFVSSKRLVAGDAFIFLRGENGELRVGIRPAMRQRENIPSSVISSRSMHYGVLATAWHAIQTGTIFTVYYKPWTCPAEFIVPYDQYMESSR